jgi:hypothetical protein
VPSGLAASVESGIGGFFGGSITVCRCSLRAASFGCGCRLLGFFGVFSSDTGVASRHFEKLNDQFCSGHFAIVVVPLSGDVRSPRLLSRCAWVR